jgi:hypothetical protein
MRESMPKRGAFGDAVVQDARVSTSPDELFFLERAPRCGA